MKSGNSSRNGATKPPQLLLPPPTLSPVCAIALPISSSTTTGLRDRMRCEPFGVTKGIVQTRKDGGEDRGRRNDGERNVKGYKGGKEAQKSRNTGVHNASGVLLRTT
ncbi:hypothetical protein E2C01_064441 [Portunus trituberculatus]|uniref:Uncharacterized protein n=1 Tax=Portunus trituberculatus TaxID=210409 RepID=A0A5B7HKC4_PORTR|nr:hypothetical protein [Portunus trituberculatus]